MKNHIGIICVLLVLQGCVSSSEHQEVLSQVVALEKQLDECENGENKIVAQIEQAVKEEKAEIIVELVAELLSRYPETSSREEMEKLALKLNKQIEEQRKAELAAKEEEKRLKEINNTGSWQIKYYVDDFGEPTKKGYITCPDVLGTFSNTATQNSVCNYRFLITSGADISFKMFEYGKNNPVKSSYSTTNYKGIIKDSNGKKIKFTGENYSDRISLGKNGSWALHKSLLLGGVVQVVLWESDNSSSEYKFTIDSTKYYDNAYRIFTGK